MVFLIAPFYILAWIVCVCAMRPQDAWEGCVALLCGLAWPVLLVGWVVSRPYA